MADPQHLFLHGSISKALLKLGIPIILINILPKHTSLGPQGIWYSFAITNVLVAIITYLWFAAGRWQRTQLTKEDKDIAKVTQETLIEEGNH